jgi:hypothetical protein
MVAAGIKIINLSCEFILPKPCTQFAMADREKRYCYNVYDFGQPVKLVIRKILTKVNTGYFMLIKS